MNAAELARLLTEQFPGYDEDTALEVANEAIESDEPAIESISFHLLVDSVLAPVHDSTWLKNETAEIEELSGGVVGRLMDSGVDLNDLAIFARYMQRHCLSNLACLLDGTGAFGPNGLPHEDFRVFAVGDEDEPQAMIDDLHESMALQELDYEVERSRRSARTTK